MRFLFDQNISHRILKLIPDKYFDSTTVKKEGLIDSSDREIWEYAKLNEEMAANMMQKYRGDGETRTIKIGN